MIRNVVVLVFGLFLLDTKAAVNQDIEFINLSVGFQYEHLLPENLHNKRLRFEGTYTRITSIFHQRKNNTILFNPKRKGTGTLIIKNTRNKILQKINVDVKKVNLHKIAKEVSDLLITIDGIEIKILNNKVIIDGEILLPKEMDRIDAVVEEYGLDLVKSFVTLSPKAQTQLALLIEKKIGYLIPPNEVRVIAHNNRFVLEGQVESEAQKKRAYLIATLYTRFDAERTTGNLRQRSSVMMVKNNIVVHTKPVDNREKLIQIIVHYVELQKSYNKSFAFQWAPQIGNDTYIETSYGQGRFRFIPTVTATISNFFPKLNWAKSFNFARILHNANLTLQNNTQGSINHTTQIPYTIRNSDGELQTTSAAATIHTKVTPTIIGLQEKTVQMKVTVQVGSFGGTTANGPITNNRTIDTQLHVRDRRSAVLGGLISSHLSKDYNRLPGLPAKTTPIINLLSSKKYDTNKGQFVVFITPIIRSSASTGVDRIRNKFKLDGD